jgi:hypothetical protein
MTASRWFLAHACDARARQLADRHYPRQKRKAARFVAPGSPIVLITHPTDAYWVTLYQRPEFTDHAWPGAWNCTAFRNESRHLSSDLIREACAATRAEWGDPPAEGMITFVDGAETVARRSRHAPPGQCFRHAGFREVGATSSGLTVLGLAASDFPPPVAPQRFQRALFAEAA